MTRRLIAGAFALGLAACGGGGANAKLVQSCNENGMLGEDICSCIADKLQASLDGATFSVVANAWGEGPAEMNSALSRLPQSKQTEAFGAVASATAECITAGLGNWRG